MRWDRATACFVGVAGHRDQAQQPAGDLPGRGRAAQELAGPAGGLRLVEVLDAVLAVALLDLLRPAGQPVAGTPRGDHVELTCDVDGGEDLQDRRVDLDPREVLDDRGAQLGVVRERGPPRLHVGLALGAPLCLDLLRGRL